MLFQFWHLLVHNNQIGNVNVETIQRKTMALVSPLRVTIQEVGTIVNIPEETRIVMKQSVLHLEDLVSAVAAECLINKSKAERSDYSLCSADNFKNKINMKTKLSVFFLVSTILICSCSNEEQKDYHKAKLAYIETVTIPISKDLALASIAKFGLENINDENCISFLEDGLNLIRIYSINNKSLIKEIRIKDDNYNSHHGSYLIHNLDSIFLLDYKNSRLFMIDSSGETKKNIDIRTERLIDTENNLGNPHVPFPTDAINSNGFVFHDNKIFLASSGMSSADYTENLKEVFVIDLNNDSVYLEMNKPEIYFKGFWGFHLLHNFQFLYNDNKDEFIVGYGVDDNIYTTNFKSSVNQHPMGSKYLTKMAPYGRHKPTQYKKSPEIEKHTITNGYYSRMYYDKITKRYYRFVDRPISSREYDRMLRIGMQETQLSMIITDENFENKVEIDLDTIHFCPAFINNDELYFIDKNAYNRNSDSLFFNVYQIEIQ